jgi:hypothetical protein
MDGKRQLAGLELKIGSPGLFENNVPFAYVIKCIASFRYDASVLQFTSNSQRFIEVNNQRYNFSRFVYYTNGQKTRQN